MRRLGGVAGLERRWFETSTLGRRGVGDLFRGDQGGPLAVSRAPGPDRPGLVGSGSWSPDGSRRSTDCAWASYRKSLNANYMRARHGGPLSPRSKAHLIWSLRTFFRDLQEWEWIERRFDPRRAFALPRSIKTLISRDPRVISDDVWAKLMWAGLNLDPRRTCRARQHDGNGARGIRWSSSARSPCRGCSPGCASMRSSASRRRDPLATPAPDGA